MKVRPPFRRGGGAKSGEMRGLGAKKKGKKESGN
jgi:hypothetical protein